MSPLELLIFDCDGVLIDSEFLGSCVIHRELLRLGHNLTLEEYIDIAVGRRKEEEKALLSERKIHLSDDFWETVSVKLLESFSLDLKAIEGIHDVLDQLTIKKCIASSSSQKRLELSLTVTDLIKYFRGAIFHGEMVAKGKPSPDVFLLAAKTMQVTPANCLVIEDSVPGIQAAKSAGMRVWGFLGGKHCSPSYIKKVQDAGADLLFHEMAELPFLLENYQQT